MEVSLLVLEDHICCNKTNSTLILDNNNQVGRPKYHRPLEITFMKLTWNGRICTSMQSISRENFYQALLNMTSTVLLWSQFKNFPGRFFLIQANAKIHAMHSQYWQENISIRKVCFTEPKKFWFRISPTLSKGIQLSIQSNCYGMPIRKCRISLPRMIIVERSSPLWSMNQFKVSRCLVKLKISKILPPIIQSSNLKIFNKWSLHIRQNPLKFQAIISVFLKQVPKLMQAPIW